MSHLHRILVFAIAALPLAAEIPSDVPAQYQAIYSNMTTQISAFQTTVNQSWNGSPYPVTWAPHLSSAESDNYLTLLNKNYFNNAVLTELLELQATGAKAVTVHISFPILYQPYYTYTGTPSNYEAFVAFYQLVASTVHSRGMKLMVEATVAEGLDGTEGADFGPYYQTLSWSEYMTQRAQNDVNVAQLIVPDYMSVLCEPDTEATNAYQPTEDSPTGSMQLLQTILTSLEQAKVTNIPIGAGTGTWIPSYTTYLQDFSTTAVNYIDLHVYPVNDNDLMNVLSGATTIQQSGGKPIAVSEVWADKLSDSELGNININTLDSRDAFSFWAPIDTSFLQAMVDCSQYEKFLFFAPSYPAYFAAYLDYNTYGSETPAQILPAAFSAASAANRAGSFTSTGTAFSTMIVGADKIKPATPAAPTGSIYIDSASITWTPTTDNIGVAGYNVYRNNSMVATLAQPPFYDTGLTPGETYTYNVSAFDAQGNVSALSPPFTGETIDLSPPSVPTGLKVTGDTTNSVSLSWSPSTGGGGVGGYRVKKGTSPTNLSTIAGYVTTTSYTDPYARANNTYYYAVESYNLLGITSAPCTPVSVTTP